MLDGFLQFLEQPSSLPRDAFFALIGACTGSFVNVMALRSLKEDNWFWPPSHCPECQHRLIPLDMVPILSWFLLAGKCRFCQKPISWQYPLVEFVTAVAFVVIFEWFGFNFEGVGLVVFSCILIAICVTDFKEKLIPHEITYPAMLLGLIYTATLQPMTMLLNDVSQYPLHHIARGQEPLLSGLAGVGICYVLFDFLAFYGLKLYEMKYGKPEEEPAPVEEEDDEGEDRDPHIDTTFDIRPKLVMEEEFAVMGGADAVCAAVIAAWLGLTRLGEVLFYGFLIGTAIGAVYLIIDLARRNELAARKRRSAIGALIGVAVVEVFLYSMWSLTSQGNPDAINTGFFQGAPWWQLGLVAAVLGGLAGLVLGGSGRTSKPFPFGPALAAGAFIAMFCDPIIGLQ